jgi:WD40 repeat protein
LHTNGAVNQASFSPDGWRLLIAGTDGLVRLWDRASVPLVARTEAPPGGRQPIFSPDSRRLLLVTGKDTLHLWDMSGRRTSAKVIRHEPFVRSALFSPDGSWPGTGKSSTPPSSPSSGMPAPIT